MKSMTQNILLAIGVLLTVAYFVSMQRNKISSADAHRLVQEGAKLVDVRSPGEFAAGHLNGAVNIPVQEINRRMAELEPKSSVIVVYCASGMRSSSAASTLKNAGFAAVHNLGSMSSW